MNEAITGVILAGGEGRRMGGRDKGLLLLDGRPLAAQVLERLRPQVGSLLISANRNLEAYRGFGVPVLTDLLPGHAGPLAGVQAALAQAATPLLLSVPCDSPVFPPNLAARLLASLEASGAALAVPRCGGRVHRAFCLMRREVKLALDAFLAAGDRKLALWQQSQAAQEVDFGDDDAAFANVNGPDELARLAGATATPR